MTHDPGLWKVDVVLLVFDVRTHPVSNVELWRETRPGPKRDQPVYRTQVAHVRFRYIGSRLTSILWSSTAEDAKD